MVSMIIVPHPHPHVHTHTHTHTHTHALTHTHTHTLHSHTHTPYHTPQVRHNWRQWGQWSCSHRGGDLQWN